MHNFPYSYQNGNVNVKIFGDGTKIREFEGEPKPLTPESIDVKITNFCDANCSYCHEESTIAGKHGDLTNLLNVLSPLPPGSEIAIGGGSPLHHPDILPFLQEIKNRNVISNITINQKHLSSQSEMIISLIKNDLVKGVGISYSSPAYLKHIEPIIKESNNVVFHLIMGINKISDINDLNELCLKHNKTCKILLLGYKQYGFGINYYVKNVNIETNKKSWYVHLYKCFKNNNLVLSFDNLAISQLNLKRYFTDESWDKFYMGNDFVFTMYIDAIEQKFAPSSTSKNRIHFNEMNLLEYFQTYRKTM